VDCWNQNSRAGKDLMERDHCVTGGQKKVRTRESLPVNNGKATCVGAGFER
jgi:hypothetical protein